MPGGFGRLMLSVVMVAGGIRLTPPALAVQIEGVEVAALDQPRVNAVIYRNPGDQPLVATVDYFGLFEFETINMEAFLDTGASGLLLSESTAQAFGIVNSPSIFEDVGVGGSEMFGVSESLRMGIAPYNPNTDLDNLATWTSVYNQRIGPVRAQVSMGGDEEDDPFGLLSGLDVLGMPAMVGKVVVMDPKPVNSLLGTMNTYLYDPGTAFNSVQADIDPGIPDTELHVRLSYGDFERFTRVTPDGSAGPTLGRNPFVGPDPVAVMEGQPGGNVPPIKVSYEGVETSGSWLLDTGAAVSMISREQAEMLGVTYAVGTYGTDEPLLEGVDVEEQFTITVGGIGGQIKAAGFYLDSLLIPTREGDPLNDDDPRHLQFMRAPVLVTDITLRDPDTDQTLTLDGVLGMNYWVASLFISESGGFDFGGGSESAFDWLVFDEGAATFGVDVRDTEFLRGDLNGDGVVDAFDLLLVLNPWGQEGVTNGWVGGDVNWDGRVDAFDMVEVLGQWGQGTSAVVLLPEAGTLLLMLSGGILMLGRRRENAR